MKYVFPLLLLVGTLFACSAKSATPTPNSSASLNLPIRPLSDILVTGPDYVGTSPDNYSVQLLTKIPIACAIVYGETTAYGNIATDPNMAGGAITDHQVQLKNLKPNTMYHARFQGSAADGIIYASDDFTFQSPSGSALALYKPAGKNVALLSAGANVKGVSSTYGGGDNNSTYGANKAIDGDPATQWSSNGDGNKAWIEIDLGKAYPLTGLGMQTRTMGSSAQISQFQVVTDKGDTLGPFTLPDANSMYYFPVNTTAQTLKFEVLQSSGGNTGAAGVEVFSGE